MAKGDDKIELEGVVVETYPGSRFLVEITTEGFEESQVRARLSGKMRMHYIRITPGDKVKLQVSPYNLDEGLITYRNK
jgi:translation initiation factor IF-1